MPRGMSLRNAASPYEDVVDDTGGAGPLVDPRPGDKGSLGVGQIDHGETAAGRMRQVHPIAIEIHIVYTGPELVLHRRQDVRPRWIADIDDHQAEFVHGAVLHRHDGQTLVNFHVEGRARHVHLSDDLHLARCRDVDHVQHAGVAAHVAVVAGDVEISREKKPPSSGSHGASTWRLPTRVTLRLSPRRGSLAR